MMGSCIMLSQGLVLSRSRGCGLESNRGDVLANGTPAPLAGKPGPDSGPTPFKPPARPHLTF